MQHPCFTPIAPPPHILRIRRPAIPNRTSPHRAFHNPEMSLKSPNDLLIVGAGVLGLMIGKQWRSRHPDAEIYGITGTEKSHVKLREAGITPKLSDAVPVGQFPRVVFCAPPNALPDGYVGAVEESLKRVGGEGRFVFTSSGSVHGRQVVGITEETPVDGGGRSAVLAEAERVVLGTTNGFVMRLAGLYTLQRGPHSYWLRTGKVGGSGDGALNLVWYGDAASAVVRVLDGGDSANGSEREDRRVYLVSAERSITRKEVCEAALKHPLYADKQMPQFGPEQGDRPSREYDNSWTREVLTWAPKYESFAEFMEEETRKALEQDVVKSG